MRRKLIYVIGSAVIGVITLISVFLVLIATGVIDAGQRKLIYRSVDADIVYDGKTLVCEEYSVIHGKLKSGHTAQVSFTGMQSGVGESQNSFAVTILDAQGADVTADYDLECIFGTLSVKQRPLLVTTAPATKMYDGTPLVNSNWSLGENNSVVEGHNLIVKTEGTQTDVGSCKNAATIQILDASGNDVTASYAVETYFGDITVTPRTLAIRTGSDYKVYSDDRRPLVCDVWEIVPGTTKPLDSHDIAVSISGQQIDIGESENTIAEVIITDKVTGENKTHNYEITKKLGTLKVFDPNADLSAEAELFKQAFKSGGSLKDNGLGRSELVIAAVNSDKDGAVYLRAQSYGDYKDNVWADAAEYPMLLDQRYGYNYLSGAAMKNSVDVSSGQVRIRSKYQYMLPYYTSMGNFNYSIQTSDVAYGSAKTEYDVKCSFYSKYGDDVVGLLGAYEDEEAAYREFVYQNYLEIPDESLRVTLDKIIETEKFDKTDAELVSKIAKYMQNFGTYDLDYNRALDEEENIINAFLTEYKRGVCRHYASAATLLYRAMGIPARYTIGVVGKSAVSGVWTDVPASSLHAWVEVYIDGLGWIMVETTGGPFKYSDRVFTITPKVTDAPYVDEETELHALNEIRGLSALQPLDDPTTPDIREGYEIKVEVVGSQKGLGMSESEVKSLVIIDPFGNDITKDLNLKFKKGTVQIYKAELKIKTESAEKTYDGKPLSIEHLTPTLTDGSLKAGDKITTLKCNTQITDVGLAVNSFDIAITNADGEDVTSHYKITKTLGNLEVKQKELYVQTSSAEKTYDGEELTSATWTLKEGYKLEDGYLLTVVCIGSQTEVGESPNSVSKAQTKVFDGNGDDVTRNYKIRYDLGLLKVINSGT